MADTGVLEDSGVSLCLCQQDSYLRELKTTVASCLPRPKRGSSKETHPPTFEVVLAATPMFPESGGQPCDTGMLAVLAPDGLTEKSVSVLEVERREGVLYHVVDAEIPQGTSISVSVDWRRRYDHMQQHTGQHVVSAVAELVCDAPTVSWELHPTSWEGLDTVAVDLGTASLTQEQILEIERRCNDEVRAMRSVRPLVIDTADPAERAERIRELSSSPNFRGQLPPSEKVKGPLRLVEIAGLDVNACGGTHLRSTGEIQLIKVVALEKAGKGAVRLRFAAGDRAIAALSRSLTRDAALTVRLSCPPQDHERAVDAVQRDKRDLTKAVRALQDELAGLLGRSLVAGHPSQGDVAVHHRPGAALDFLSLVATLALEVSPNSVLLLTGDTTTPAQPPSATGPLEAIFLLAGPPNAVKRLGPGVAAGFGGRGGGRPGRFQGKATVAGGMAGLKQVQDGLVEAFRLQAETSAAAS